MPVSLRLRDPPWPAFTAAADGAALKLNCRGCVFPFFSHIYFTCQVCEGPFIKAQSRVSEPHLEEKKARQEVQNCIVLLHSALKSSCFHFLREHNLVVNFAAISEVPFLCALESKVLMHLHVLFHIRLFILSAWNRKVRTKVPATLKHILNLNQKRKNHWVVMFSLRSTCLFSLREQSHVSFFYWLLTLSSSVKGAELPIVLICHIGLHWHVSSWCRSLFHLFHFSSPSRSATTQSDLSRMQLMSRLHVWTHWSVPPGRGLVVGPIFMTSAIGRRQDL